MNLDQFECLKDFNNAKFPISAISALFESTVKIPETGLKIRHITQNLTQVEDDLNFLASLFFKDKNLFSMEISADINWRDYFEFAYISAERGIEFSPINAADSSRIYQKIFSRSDFMTKIDMYFWFRSHQDDALAAQTPMCTWGKDNGYCTYSMHGKFEPKEAQ